MTGPQSIAAPGTRFTQTLTGPHTAPTDSGALPLDTRHPELIAQHLRGVLAQPDMHPDARDLALAKCIRARDFITTSSNSRVRNILRAGPAREAGLLGESTWQLHEALQTLLRGRHYLAVTHGEGPRSRIRLVLDRPHEFFPKVLIWEPGKSWLELRHTPPHTFFDSPDDRIILGPHIRYQHRSLRAGPLYQEMQSGLDCGIHAINALAGEQRISKAQAQALLMQKTLSSYVGSGLTDDDFYLNIPRSAGLCRMYDIGNGLDPDIVQALLHEHLPGEVERSPLGADREQLIGLAQQWQRNKAGFIVLVDNHYVAFKKARNPRTNRNEWVFIDSAQPEQASLPPLVFLEDHSELSQCVLFGWKPPAMHHDCLPCCNLQ